MWVKLIASISVYKIVIIGLLQSQIVSDSMFRLFEQFPIVGLVIFTLYYMQKQHREDTYQTREWLEHMLDVQRSALQEIYENRDRFLSALLTQMETKQEETITNMRVFSQQMAINTSTVNEIAKVDSIVSELIDKLDQK